MCAFISGTRAGAKCGSARRLVLKASSRSITSCSLSVKRTLGPPMHLKDGPKLGTYRWLCVEYFKSTRFSRLDPRSRRVRRSVLEKTCDEPIFQGAQEKFADYPLTRLTAKSVRVLRDRRAELPA